MLSVHQFVTALVLAELMAGCCQVLVPPTRTEQRPSHPLLLLGQLPYCTLVHLKGRQEKARLIPLATAQLRKREVFIHLSEPMHLPLSVATCLDECCYSEQGQEAAELELCHLAHCLLSYCCI